MTETVAMKGARLDARYTLLDKLGAGGQGEVWRAHDEIRGVDIALKVLNPSLARDDGAWDALEHEYAIATRLDHPSILKVFPPDRSGDSLVLPMELASGGDLRRLRGAGFLEIIPVLLEIAQALEHAHARGVVHRDLKPGNVLFDARGRARLADFGVAETAGASAAAPEVTDGATRDTSRHGFSPFTASPAQLRGDPPTPADDIYGLGALAYELLSGYPPYYPHFDKQRAMQDRVPRLVPTRQIPPLLGVLVMRMLEKDPRRRPHTMREVIDELESALNDTLTFDIESAPESPRGDAIPRPARFAPQMPAANSTGDPGSRSIGTAESGAWSPRTAGDRRRTQDRRSRPREDDGGIRRGNEVTSLPVQAPSARPTLDSASAAQNAPAAAPSAQNVPPTSSASAGGSASVVTPPPSAAATVPARSAPSADSRSGADALARIEAELERAGVTSTSALGTRSAPAQLPAAAPAAPLTAYPPVAGVTISKQAPRPTRGERMHATWAHVPLEGLPRVDRLQPIRSSRGPWIVLALLLGVGVAAALWLPQLDSRQLPPEVAAVVTPIQSAINAAKLTASAAVQPRRAASLTATPSVEPTPAASDEKEASAPPNQGLPAKAIPDSVAADSSAAAEQRFKTMRQLFDKRVAALESKGAGAWGGRDFALAKTRAAESVGARDAGSIQVAQEKLMAANRLLDSVESRASQAARRAQTPQTSPGASAVQPLLVDARAAESANDFARAAQDYSQALMLDPENAPARAGQARANAAFGDDGYAKAVGAGFAALGAGRLDEAHSSFVKARSLKPGGTEALEGLKRVSAALTARGFASIRQRAATLEAQERWDDAEQAYDDVLSADPTMSFALEGKARSSSRAELAGRLQQIIDRPDRLSSAGARSDARSLLETAQAQSPQGPVLRSQIARVQALLPAYDRTVRLSLQSDNSTQIAIPSVGSLGTFSHREIELRPGKYVVVGTRYGFREVRQEITVSPGQNPQTIRVSCSDPI